jgi:ribosomal protein RSM22 (predicted rRNA methylase)
MALVRALEDDWRDAIEGVLRAHGWPTLADVARLGALTRRLSDAYNEIGADQSKELLVPRLAFSFARDTPKGAAAVRELVALGLLEIPTSRALRVLDWGAGIGAMTWGVARALDAAGQAGALDASWFEPDARAQALGLELARAAPRGNVVVSARRASPAFGRERFDLVLVGQVLSELDRDLGDEARAVRHAEHLRALLDAVEPDGSLVVVEPALRDRTRHLHRVRDLLLSTRAAGVFAPCLHADACPALGAEGDWCHEDLPVDLPHWLVPIARAAGLRWQGLTFSYLVLRRDGRSLADAMPDAARLRAVSELFVSKGKKELLLCGRLAPAGSGTRLRAVRLDRDESDANRDWADLRRGELVSVAELAQDRPRIAKETALARAPLLVGSRCPRR